MIVRILASVAGTIAAPLVGGLAYRKVRQPRVAKALMIGIPNGIVEERFVGIDPPRSFEPLGNEMIAGMYATCRSRPAPELTNLCATPAGTTTTCPPLASITSSPTVKVALPSCTTKTSS
jgi:hypothetical protein